MAANEYGPYYLLLASGVVQFANSLYGRHIRRRDQKRDEERKSRDKKELEWKRKTDFQVEELRELMREVRRHLRERWGVDIKMDR